MQIQKPLRTIEEIVGTMRFRMCDRESFGPIEDLAVYCVEHLE